MHSSLYWPTKKVKIDGWGLCRCMWIILGKTCSVFLECWILRHFTLSFPITRFAALNLFFYSQILHFVNDFPGACLVFFLLLKLLESHKYYFYGWTSNIFLEWPFSVSSVLRCCCAVFFLVTKNVPLPLAQVFFCSYTQAPEHVLKVAKRTSMAPLEVVQRPVPIDFIGHCRRPEKQFPGEGWWFEYWRPLFWKVTLNLLSVFSWHTKGVSRS